MGSLHSRESWLAKIERLWKSTFAGWTDSTSGVTLVRGSRHRTKENENQKISGLNMVGQKNQTSVCSLYKARRFGLLTPRKIYEVLPDPIRCPPQKPHPSA